MHIGILSLLFLGLLAQGAETVAPAQAPNAPLAGHSMHGESFNEGPRQQAYLMKGMARVHFPISSKVPQVQEFFNQGISQLHGFWYFEAERTFRQVVNLDPDCPMGYWGLAMANVQNDKRAKSFIKKASDLASKADPREKLWIESLSAFYNGNGDQKARRRNLVRALEKIVQEYPDDVEAKAFLVFQIWDNSQRDLPINSHQAVDSLLNDIFRVAPEHPAHHYRIHLWDYEKAERALGAAAQCGQSSPGIAHMWHMSGHIFSKLHRYTDAVWQQEASARVDHAHMMRDRILPDQIHNYSHNNEWLVRNLMYIGRVHDSIDLAKNMIELPRHPKHNTLENNKSSGLGRTRLFDVLSRFELWDEMLQLGETIYLEPTTNRNEQLRRLRHLGVAGYAKGEEKTGHKYLEELQGLLKKEKESRQEDIDKAEAKAKEEKLSDDKIQSAMTDAIKSHADKIKNIEKAIAEVAAYADLQKKDRDVEKLKKQFEELKDIPKDRLSLVYAQLGDTNKALTLAKEGLDGNTNQVQFYALYAEMLKRAGDEKKAREVFDQLRSLSSDIDMDIPIFKRMAPLAQAAGLSGDWRIAKQASPDAGKRPEISTLGPFRWQPTAAPEWKLTTVEGKTVTSQSLRGKPVVLLFYLGHSCLHCIEQLNAFSPRAKEFEEAGISLVAISADSKDGLQKSLEKLGKDKEFPFPIYSDEKLEAFKAYRAFDDFEKMPLHGTFLVDGQGLLRWQDISFEPFKEVTFLLEESKRLLQQPKMISGSKRQTIANRFGLEGAPTSAKGGAGLLLK